MKHNVDYTFYRNAIRTLNRVEQVEGLRDYVAKYNDWYGVELPSYDPTDNHLPITDAKDELNRINIANFLKLNFYNMQEKGNTPNKVVVGCVVDKFTKIVELHAWLETELGDYIEADIYREPSDFIYYALFDFDAFEIVKKSENEDLDDMGVKEEEEQRFNPDFLPFEKPHRPHKHNPWDKHFKNRFPVLPPCVDWLDLKEYIHPVSRFEVEYYTTQPQV